MSSSPKSTSCCTSSSSDGSSQGLEGYAKLGKDNGTVTSVKDDSSSVGFTSALGRFGLFSLLELFDILFVDRDHNSF